MTEAAGEPQLGHITCRNVVNLLEGIRSATATREVGDVRQNRKDQAEIRSQWHSEE